MAMQQTLVLIKPDGLVKSLTGNIITALSETKLKIIGARIVRVSRELAEKHYSQLKEEKIKEHGVEKGTEIYESVLKYVQGHYHTDRVFAIVYQGEDAIQKVRDIAGKTNPEKADPTTIRGRYGRIHSQTQVFENVIHCSDSPQSAEREIKLWFAPNELTEKTYPSKNKKFSEEKAVWT